MSKRDKLESGVDCFLGLFIVGGAIWIAYRLSLLVLNICGCVTL